MDVELIRVMEHIVFSVTFDLVFDC